MGKGKSILKGMDGVKWRDLTDAELDTLMRGGAALLTSGGVTSVPPNAGVVYIPYPAPVIIAALKGIAREKVRRAGQPRKRIKFKLMPEETWL